MTVAGPLSLYGQLAGGEVAEEEIRRSIQLVAGFGERQFQTFVAPVRDDGGLRYLTPDEIAATAELIEQGSGSKQQPYILRLYRKNGGDAELAALELMSASELFPYRSKARTYQVKTEIEREA